MVAYYCPPPFMGDGDPVGLVFTDHAVSGGGGTTHTFTARNFGTAAEDRQVVVAITSTGQAQISGITIGGVSADILESYTPTSTLTMVICSATIPTGTSGDVVVSFAATNNRVGIGVYALYNADTAPFDTLVATPGDPVSGSLNAPRKSAVVALARNASSGSSFVWTGLAENYDEAVLATRQSGASGAFAEAVTGHLIEADASDGTSSGLIAVSWGRPA